MVDQGRLRDRLASSHCMCRQLSRQNRSGQKPLRYLSPLNDRVGQERAGRKVITCKRGELRFGSPEIDQHRERHKSRHGRPAEIRRSLQPEHNSNVAKRTAPGKGCPLPVPPPSVGRREPDASRGNVGGLRKAGRGGELSRLCGFRVSGFWLGRGHIGGSLGVEPILVRSKPAVKAQQSG